MTRSKKKVIFDYFFAFVPFVIGVANANESIAIEMSCYLNCLINHKFDYSIISTTSLSQALLRKRT